MAIYDEHHSWRWAVTQYNHEINGCLLWKFLAQLFNECSCGWVKVPLKRSGYTCQMEGFNITCCYYDDQYSQYHHNIGWQLPARGGAAVRGEQPGTSRVRSREL
ncbi:hypothetical protein CDAR_257871 [Caerostris darwini]|uniref:Uncharacterized protein n=1 Tax=Caerostris darwini TaxID=1538125 RepID=A0AAV4WW81_9ARAC|nr:hypothetical protein CDAR_257871 [Caerostris darwini]